MKRFHVHVHVDDLQKNIAFYSRLFGAEPTRTESDYAKWMLDDPAVNFAISARGGEIGIDHLGFQTDDPAELEAMKSRAQAADFALLDEGETTCCYARSEKYWITDPQGIAWEQYHTLENIPVFSEGRRTDAAASACCATSAPPSAQPEPDIACCAPTPARAKGKPVAIPVGAAKAKCC